MSTGNHDKRYFCITTCDRAYRKDAPRGNYFLLFYGEEMRKFRHKVASEYRVLFEMSRGFHLSLVHVKIDILGILGIHTLLINNT